MIQMLIKEECYCIQCRKKKLTNAELWEKKWKRIEHEMVIMSELGVRAYTLEMRRQRDGKE